MSNFLSIPKEPLGRGILVIHPWWGLNDFIKRFAERLSENGYHVLAVDLYDGRLAHTIPEAEKLKSTLTRKQVEPLLLKSAQELQTVVDGQPLGLIGFSLGAWWSLWLNEQIPEAFAATVLFYGTRGMKDFSTRSAFLGHFAENDPYVMDSGRMRLEKTLRSAGRQVDFHLYPGTQHWFFESDRPEYEPLAAQLAWQRTHEFLQTWLGRA
jgi:carboxymethylenebutenolidase